VSIKILWLLISPRNFFLGDKASKQASNMEESEHVLVAQTSELHENKRREKLADACFSKPNVGAKITVPGLL
jgi:hypothetical protein